MTNASADREQKRFFVHGSLDFGSELQQKECSALRRAIDTRGRERALVALGAGC